VNLLILDEPTNHLDMRSKDVLKSALREFDGTVIVVSHDREFLDGLVDKVYEFGGGCVKEHLGGIYDFLERKKIESLRELERSTATTPTVANDLPPASKLSYGARKEQAKTIRKAEKAVADAEGQIASIEKDLHSVEAQLATPGGASDTSLYTQHATLKAQLASAIDQWAALSEELERLGGDN
jgi:ATP-binding cassette subfamily F protein 3